jgi:hypothetical protein
VRTTIRVSLGAVCIGLTGCNALDTLGLHSVAAENLEQLGTLKANAVVAATAAGAASPTNKDIVGAIVVDSETKCATFADHLVLHENTANTALDVATTVFSALGTLFTPLATVHAMTAAASITSGSKTAIDTDIYAKATIANFAQAIQVTYYTDIGNYLNNLNAADEKNISPQIEYAKITTIHRECGLAPAEASISAALQPTQTQATTLAASYAVKGGDTTVAIAAALMASINSMPAFKNAGVSASQQSPSVLVLNAPATAPVSWSTTVASAAGAAAGTETATVTTKSGVTTLTVGGTITSNDTITLTGAVQPSQVVVPGHKP